MTLAGFLMRVVLFFSGVMIGSIFGFKVGIIILLLLCFVIALASKSKIS